MSTLPVTNTLTSFFVPIGWAGAIFAIACALVVLVALARGAAGLTGGAIGVWFVGALLSVVSSFAGQWTPLVLSGVALLAALVLGGIVRMLTVSRPSTGHQVALPVVTAESAQPSPQPTVVSTVTVKTQPARSSGSPATA